MNRNYTACVAVLLGALLPLSVAAQEGGQQGGVPQGPPPPDMRAIEALRARFEQEPSAQEVQKAALKFFRVNPEVVEDYRKGAKWQALAPEFEGTFNYHRDSGDRRLIDQLYTLSERFRDGKDFEFTNSNGYTVGVRAHWYLGALVYNPQTLDVASLVGVQEGLLREVTSLYFTRRRLMTMFSLNPPQDPAEQITEYIRLDEITANIDALTGGWFSEELKTLDEQQRTR